LEQERKISIEKGRSLATELNAFFAEVSAKTRDGIDELFLRIGEEAFKKLIGDGGQPRVASQSRRSSVVLNSEKSPHSSGCTC
jgi:hypothetical protein